MGCNSRKLKAVWEYYKTPIVVFLTPILLLPIPFAIDGKESLAAYILFLMAIYWCTEALPLGVTALIPIFLVPLFGIMDVKSVAASYMSDTTLLLIGGLIVALAVEKANLHRRLAIKVLLLIGTSPRWLMLGFMVPTWFLSMWISNTAATAMMIPIVEEVAFKLIAIKRIRTKIPTTTNQVKPADDHPSGPTKPSYAIPLEPLPHPDEASVGHVVQISSQEQLVSTKEGNYESSKEKPSAELHNGAVEVMEEGQDSEELAPIDESEMTPEDLSMVKGLIIAIAFASSIGGIGSIIGTGGNIIAKGQADEIWIANGYTESPVNFTSWLILGMPLACINLIITWIWLEIYFIGIKEFCGIGKKKKVPTATLR